MAAYEYFNSQKQWESYLKDLLKTNNQALLKSIVLIYDNQTDDEKQIGASVEDNNLGFSKWDAEEMSDIARKLKRGEALKPNEIIHSRLVMPKYWKQLMFIAKNQIEIKKKNKKPDSETENVVLKIPKEKQQEIELFRQHNEILRKCLDEGKRCTFGICSDCPVNTGIQLKMSV